MSKILIRTLKIALLILGMSGALLIGFYRVPNQDLTLKVKMDKTQFKVDISEAELKKQYDCGENGNIEIEYESKEKNELKEIKVFRHFKTIAIAKFNSNSIREYGSYDISGIHFNEAGIKYLYEMSRTFFLERIIYTEMLICIIVFLWLIINALREKMDPNNRDNHGPIYEISMFIKNFVKYRQYMIYAAKADLKAEVANSYLNRLWWILEPFCNMIVYVIVFGRVMGNSIEKYATFIFSALLMWSFFNHIANYSVKCVRNNRDIVTKIYVPKYILLVTNMVLNLIKLLFSLIVLIVMLAIFRVSINLTIVWIVPAFMLMFLLSFGMGMILLHYGVFIDDLGYAVGILLNLLMYLSGTFYDVLTALPEPLNYILVCCNPVVVFIESMRNALLYKEITNVPLVIVWTFMSLLISYIGIHIVNRNENGYVKVI